MSRTYKVLKKAFVTNSCKHPKKLKRGKYHYCLNCGTRLVPNKFINAL